jgi:hypothetical protein
MSARTNRVAGILLAGVIGCTTTEGQESIPQPPYDHLSQTGLYVDLGTKTLAATAIEFRPAFELWSDGALKRRWLLLPEASMIDTSDMDHWLFPVGTRVFKEFRLEDGSLLETRLIQRVSATGHGETDYWMGAFVWRPDASEADFAPEGAENVLGTELDVPDAETCWACHNGEPGHLLGLSAIQSASPGATMALPSWAGAGILSHPPSTGAELSVPGDDVTRTALGYLHANCGSCHNPNGTSWPDADMDLRLTVSDRTPEATTIYQTTVGVDLTRVLDVAVTKRVAPGDPDASGIVTRMMLRDGEGEDQMPPIASELVHDDGIARVRAWIERL